MKHSAPARGALAGIKADAQKAKESGGVYDPRGAGAAWTHNFLNQKPWHPLNFRNQARVFEAEQQAINDAKRNAEAKAQFEAEQEQMQAISYLSEQGQKEYAARQSLAFMYMKPPGLDAALSKGNEEQAASAQAGSSQPQASTSLTPSAPQQEQQQPPQQGRHRKARQEGPRSSVSNMLGAMAALHQNDKWEMKHVSSGMSRSPPRGGGDSAAANQQFLVSSSEDDGPQQEASPNPPQPPGQEPVSAQPGKPSKRERKRRRLEEAKALLRQHGLPVPEDDGASGDESDADQADEAHHHKRKRHKAGKDKEKKKKRHKHKSKI